MLAVEAVTSDRDVGRGAAAEPFTTASFESVAMMLSLPSTMASSMASTVKLNAPCPCHR